MERNWRFPRIQLVLSRRSIQLLDEGFKCCRIYNRLVIKKLYNPADSYGFTETSTPGTRNLAVDVDLQFLATLPDSEQMLTATYETSPGAVPQANTNMQVRYESTNLLANPMTDGSGIVNYTLNVSVEWIQRRPAMIIQATESLFGIL